MLSQRFVRPMPEGIMTALVDMRVDGLQSTSYAACVRCVAPCGCESACSPWSFLPIGPMAPPPAPAPVSQVLLHTTVAGTSSLIPHTCPPPPCAPPSLPL